jgi:hypothetical protein
MADLAMVVILVYTWVWVISVHKMCLFKVKCLGSYVYIRYLILLVCVQALFNDFYQNRNIVKQL